ncbi:hypothetical protein F4782DRAFT_199484 [Xylaria castorea]|nr:hypothetical protein F4782DRAFT_199484 [Xylaria castorea]
MCPHQKSLLYTHSQQDTKPSTTMPSTVSFIRQSFPGKPTFTEEHMVELAGEVGDRTVPLSRATIAWRNVRCIMSKQETGISKKTLCHV